MADGATIYAFWVSEKESRYLLSHARTSYSNGIAVVTFRALLKRGYIEASPVWTTIHLITDAGREALKEVAL
jgi:hypothetical protein